MDNVNIKSSDFRIKLLNELSKNLRLLMTEFGINLKQLSKKTGIPYTTLQNYTRKINIPDALNLMKIASVFGVSINWLLTGEGSMFAKQIDSLALEEYIMVPLLEGSVQAGPEGRLLFDSPADMYPFKKYWIIKKVGPSPNRHKHLFLIRVTGDSMIPTINPGEVVLVDTWENERINLKNGKIYLIRQPDGAISVKRIVLTEKQRLTCLSDNPLYEPFEFNIDPERTLSWYILGRIRWVGREID